MSRSRTPFISGTITDNPLTNVATTINSAGLSSLPAIASPDIAVLVLDPTGSAGAPEVVYVTAHTGSATSATISRGKEGSSGRQHATGVSWVHGPTTYDLKGWRLEGSNTTEQTTVAGSAVDLVTISGLLIPVTQTFKILFNARKSSGAASAAYVGLKINTTTVSDVGGSGHIGSFSATNQAEFGNGEMLFLPRSTNYLKPGTGDWIAQTAAGVLTVNSTIQGCSTADCPNVTITDIIIRGNSVSASQTLAVKNVQVLVLDT